MVSDLLWALDQSLCSKRADRRIGCSYAFIVNLKSKIGCRDVLHSDQTKDEPALVTTSIISRYIYILIDTYTRVQTEMVEGDGR